MMRDRSSDQRSDQRSSPPSATMVQPNKKLGDDDVLKPLAEIEPEALR